MFDRRENVISINYSINIYIYIYDKYIYIDQGQKKISNIIFDQNVPCHEHFSSNNGYQQHFRFFTRSYKIIYM